MAALALETPVKTSQGIKMSSKTSKHEPNIPKTPEKTPKGKAPSKSVTKSKAKNVEGCVCLISKGT